ncbi:iron complex transport system permease protein [Gordonia malaquae]|uniref:Putative iron-siderophore ABC transporter permease protein n=1 Tax=Gordonia malaquae NBRC 108250 TaxID=1223542 RepID=M3UMZ3_GORML|nr:iron ABC transporter permease [Gordonia malaquae]GAC81355.1 putative iron-siderophore ABC transporter permease protein [Gordonia malaquae NBRC 108250]SEC07529.1 iron complex transport system permease protein [Gordonia malaquae]
MTRTRVTGRIAFLLIALAVLAVLFCVSIAFGNREVSLDEIGNALFGSADSFGEAAIVKRVPRTVLAILVGAALALSGAGMQAVTRNPVADPAILGISGGASLAVVVGLVFFGLTDPYSFIGAAIIGAALTALFVYAVGSMGRGGPTPLKLALSGAATAAAITCLISAVLLPRVDVMSKFQRWQVGGVGGAEWDRIAALAPVLGVGVLITFACARGMNSLALGDDVATGLGENVARTRLLTGVAAVVLAGAATAIAGPIGFVGLLVPHACRAIIGTDHRWLLPFTALVGASLLVLSDVVGRVIARPEEVDVGVVTAIIGAPFFIWIVRRQKVREL